MKFYTGIGSRKTPESILNTMTEIAQYFENNNFILRSGGAIGADTAFELGSKNKEIFKPEQCNDEALLLASKFHPKWNSLSDYVKKLHGRNAFQVLGINLNTPSKFVICWTPDGCISHKQRSIKTGGTGTAISIADYYKIPIYNLNITRHYNFITSIIKNKKQMAD